VEDGAEREEVLEDAEAVLDAEESPVGDDDLFGGCFCRFE